MATTGFMSHLSSYFNLTPDKEDEQKIIDQICSGISFRGANLWVLILAIFIASLGLNINSTAVIIGAMLISPLMGPIIGMGLAVGINDLELLKRSAKNYGVATLISVLTATIYFLITPISEAQSELLARTSPTLYDVLIAFCGGAAGIIALCTGGKGNVIPGVAIATALMPPLCTVGFGLANGYWLYSLGAFYLFFINTVFIALSTFGCTRLLHFQKKEYKSQKRATRIVTTIVVLTMLPAILMTVSIVRKSIMNSNVQKFIKAELTQRGTQIISNSIDKDSLKLNIVAVGKEIDEGKVTEAEQKMKLYGLESYHLHIIQGTQSDSILALSNQLTFLTNSRENERQKLLELSSENATLNEQLSKYTYLEELAPDIRSELATLFPQVSKLSMARALEVNRDSTNICHFVTAIVQTTDREQLSTAESQKLHDWLQTRTKTDSLVIAGDISL
ncbi:MAG: TIGR00341 family protein [Prevotella sp.]|nr:TIGR00341 family protein [Prevotella sp.]